MRRQFISLAGGVVASRLLRVRQSATPVIGYGIAENGMSDDEESVRQEALAEEQFLLVELPAALRKIRAKAKGNEKLARKLVFGKLKYTGPEASFSSSHASVMKALDECFHVIVGKAADEIDKTRELLKELKREVMMR